MADQDCHVLVRSDLSELIKLPVVVWGQFDPYGWCIWKSNPTLRFQIDAFEDIIEVPVHDPCHFLLEYQANFPATVLFINVAHRIIVGDDNQACSPGGIGNPSSATFSSNSDFIIKEIENEDSSITVYRIAARYIIAGIVYTPTYATCKSRTMLCSGRSDLSSTVYDAANRLTNKLNWYCSLPPQYRSQMYCLPNNWSWEPTADETGMRYARMKVMTIDSLGSARKNTIYSLARDTCLLDENQRKLPIEECPDYFCSVDECRVAKPVLLRDMIPLFVPGYIMCKHDSGCYLTQFDNEICAWLYKEDNPFYGYTAAALGGGDDTYTSFENRDVLVMWSCGIIVKALDKSSERDKKLLEILGCRQLYYPPELTDSALRCMRQWFHYVPRMERFGSECLSEEDIIESEE